jgi:nucleotide-binding universal stress UspA family protein
MPSKPGVIRDIVVQLTGSSEDDFRLSAAVRIAEQFDAHLLGAHLQQLPEILDIANPAQSATVRELLDESERESDKSFRSLAARFAELKVSNELKRLHGLSNMLGNDLAQIARTADLFVGTRPYGDPTGHMQIEERVLFGSGRACVFLPPGGTAHDSFERITVAWNGSREAARAVAEAMPFLTRAKAVHLVSIGETEKKGSFHAIKAHLEHYGVAAEATTVPYANGTGEQVEQFAHQMGADLIVMGAYGHARLVEWMFGGATRYLLRHATLPVLMAH